MKARLLPFCYRPASPEVASSGRHFRPFRPAPRLLQRAKGDVRQFPILRKATLNGVRVYVLGDGVSDPCPVGAHVARLESLRLRAAIRAGHTMLKELATGDTQRARYSYLAAHINGDVRRGFYTWEEFAAQTFWCHGDEYRGLSPKNPNSFAHYVQEQFLRRLEIPDGPTARRFFSERVHLLDGSAAEAGEVSRARGFIFRAASQAAGRPIADARQFPQISRFHFEVSLGLGPGGHILFNEAKNGAFRHLPMGVIPLSQATRSRKDASYPVDFTEAFTWRGEIFWGKRIDMLVTKPGYARELVRAFESRNPDEDQRRDFCPARELLTHRAVNLYLSNSAADMILPARLS